MTEKHHEFMRRAIRLSQEKMLKNSGGPFGAVIVKSGEIIAEGYNQVILLNDPTAHAEIIAIRNACESLGSFHLTDTVIYCSCEPCPMCLAAIYWARIDRIFYANTCEDAQSIGFSDHAFYKELSKINEQRKIPSVQLLADEAKTAFKEWVEKDDKTPY